MVNPFGSRLVGVDEIYNGDGVQLAPLGFGFANDWEIIKKETYSGASNIDVFWAADTYDEVEVVIKGLQPGTDDRNVLLQISDDGSTFESGSIYDYFFDIVNHAYGRAFRGARVALSSDPGPGDLDGDINWSSEVFDTDGFWAASPNPNRLTIPNPTDITKVRLTSSLWFNSVTGNTVVFSRIFENASITHAATNASAANADPGRTMDSGDIAVSPGDYFTVGLSLSDTSYGLNTSGTYFALEVTETIDDQEGHGAAQSSVLLARALGTGTNEKVDAIIRFSDVSGTDYKKFEAIWNGIIADGNARTAEGGGTIANAAQLRGFRLSGESSATLSADEIIVRGRKTTNQPIKSQNDWVVIEDSVSPTAAATHDFFWDDQVWDEIEISINGLVVGTDNRDVFIRLSSDGSTFHSGATDYEYSFFNQNSSGTSGGAESSTGDSALKVAFALGNLTDEDVDVLVRMNGISNTTKKQRVFAEGTGYINNGTYHLWTSRGVDGNTNDSTRGIQVRADGTATVTWDRLRIRGRRLTPTGAEKQDWEIIETIDIAETGSMATIPFTDIPATEFDEFELTIHDLNSDTTAQQLTLEFSGDNGSTWDTGANYQYASLRHAAESSYAEDRTNAGNNILLSQNFGSTSVRIGHGTVWFANLYSGSRKHVLGRMTTINDSGNQRILTGGGFWFGTGSAGVVTAFRLNLAAGGNFNGGKFILRGRRRV